MTTTSTGLIASRKHTGIVLGIVAAIAVAGATQLAQVAPAGDVGPRTSRVVPYLVLVALQLFWVHYVRLGLKA